MLFRSPAKINLFLRVLKRRDDGYHELASLFQAIDLCDTLNVELAEKDLFSCSEPTLPVDASNLVVKAIHLFRQKTGLKFNFKIHLEKKIPHQAGLGGGSSNAATTLYALNQLVGQPIDLQTLQQWGAELGSDVPFFFSGGTAYCTGRGEEVQSLPPLASQDFWIVKPAEGVATALVYQNLDPQQLPQTDSQTILKQFFDGTPHYFNDLENAAFSIVPQLMALKKELQNRGHAPVLLCGSGSSFFCGKSEESPNLFGCQIFKVSFLNKQYLNWY